MLQSRMLKRRQFKGIPKIKKARVIKTKKEKKSIKEKAAQHAGKKKEVKKETGLGLSEKKNENFGDWYSEVVVQGEMIEYYDVSGCYILRPWAYSIWETLHDFFDVEIKKMGIKNSYFPLFVSEKALTKEKNHIEGFAPEVAWVTKSGGSDLEVPIAIRPTSETVMYPIFSKWIRGHRDLPLKLNQWCNVVRWEFKHPTAFIRSREFLWQEGHTAFATKEEADEEIGVMIMIHGDDKGLVIPPCVAPLQIIVIAVPFKEADTHAILNACSETVQKLRSAGFRVDEDNRDNYSPGWKYSHWELKGVPLRIEIGPKDLEKKQVRVVRRDNFAKEDVSMDMVTKRVEQLLEEIQKSMYERAKAERDSCIVKAANWEEFMNALNDRKMVLAPWCDEVEVEENVKTTTKGEMGAAKTLCMPFDQEELPEGAKCIFEPSKPAKAGHYGDGVTSITFVTGFINKYSIL